MNPYRVEAYNTAVSSENKIHDDSVARRFGFSGALVPGVEVYAYMMHLPVERWGRAFLERGSAECRFASPVYDGQMTDMTAQEVEGALTIEVDSQGKRCATGSARLAPTPFSKPDIEAIPAGRPPAAEARADASETTLAVGGQLHSFALAVTSEYAAGYLRDVRETDPLYAREGLVHPGIILRLCNMALLQSVKLGPWIHVGSVVQNHSAALVGEALSSRARIAENYERKGHRFVEFDVLVLAGESRPVAKVRHTAIYRPRQVAD